MILLNDRRLNDSVSILKTLSQLKKGKPLNLKEFVAVPRFGISGISTGKFGKFWFVLPKGRALFKVFDGECFLMPRNLSLINELLCSQLAKQIKLPCADYEIAKHGMYEGLVSYDLLTNDEAPVNIMHTDLMRVSQELDNYMGLGFNVDKQSILDDLFKAIIFQILTLQTDVKTDGFVFAKNDKSNSIRFAGIVDNEFAFNIQHFSKPSPNEDAFGIFGDKHEFKAEQVIKDFDSCADLRSLLDMPFVTIMPNNSGISGDFEYAARIKEVCSFARTNSHAKKILTQVLSKLNADKAFEEMEKQDRVWIDESYKTYVKNIIEFGKIEFEKGLQQPQEVS